MNKLRLINKMNSKQPMKKKSPNSIPILKTFSHHLLKKSVTSLPAETEESKKPQLARCSTLKPLPVVNPSQIILRSQIGSGQSSSVFSGTIGSHQFAIKIIPKDYKKYAKNEISILKRLKDPSIVKFYNKFEKPDCTWIVLELVQGVDLFTYKQRNKRLPFEFIRNLAKQLVTVLQTIHQSGIIIRDLKPENIMIQSDGKIKLVDFGLSVIFSDEKINSICGSAQYMAPEVVKGEHYDYSIDFWSLGALLFECFVGKPPFDGSNFKEICESILNCEPDLGKIHNVWARDFIRKLLNKAPEERLGQINSKTVEIWNHRFLKDNESEENF